MDSKFEADLLTEVREISRHLKAIAFELKAIKDHGVKTKEK